MEAIKFQREDDFCLEKGGNWYFTSFTIFRYVEIQFTQIEQNLYNSRQANVKLINQIKWWNTKTTFCLITWSWRSQNHEDKQSLKPYVQGNLVDDFGLS